MNADTLAGDLFPNNPLESSDIFHLRGAIHFPKIIGINKDFTDFLENTIRLVESMVIELSKVASHNAR